MPVFAKTMIAVSVALVLAAACVAPATAAKAKTRHYVPGVGRQNAPAANTARTPAVLPFTADEQALFDRASRVLGAGR